MSNVVSLKVKDNVANTSAIGTVHMRIMIADDHKLVCDTIAMLLEAEGMAEVVSVENLEAAVRTADASGSFDLVLLDFNMPGMDGFHGLARMKEANDGRPVAILSGSATPQIARDAIAAGAVGFVPKTLGAKSMVSAIRFMLAGETFLPYNFNQLDEARTVTNLSERETQVLRGLCECKSNKEIARDLDLQEVTIKLHVKTLCRKLDAKNRAHAAMIARDRKLL